MKSLLSYEADMTGLFRIVSTNKKNLFHQYKVILKYGIAMLILVIQKVFFW